MLSDDELPKALAHFQKALAGETGLFETQFYRKDGEGRTISVTYSTQQRDEEVLCLIRDVTDQKMLQEQLIQSEKMSAIGQLVSGVAHELNNPLAGISAFAQLLLAEKRFPPDQRTAAETIYSEARRASRIVQNLLTFARQHKAEKVSTAINQVLDDTLELRGYELRVRGIDVRREYDESIPDTMADAHQLQQVFLNLITNAEQAMEQREGHHHRLTVSTRRSGDAIRIEVEDTGAGIPANLIERIFNPFFTTKPTGSGTGLGLSISLGIVREHEGKIWAENSSQSGAGARFVVEIPITEARASGEHAAVAHVEAQRPDSLRVLVIDDEAPVRVSLQRYLAAKGHQVETTPSGKDGLLPLLAVVSLASPLTAQEPFDFYSRGPYRPAVPRPEAITGYAAGEQHTMYAVMQHYLDTLVATASDRVRIETWGRTSEFRPIRALIISDPANLAKLDQIRAGIAELADPRKTSAPRATATAAQSPAVAGFQYSVHGDEPAGFEAAMQVAYQLAASDEPQTLEILKSMVVVLNPSANPHGHERFAARYNSLGVGADHPWAFEH